MNVSIISKYFSPLSERQQQQFDQLRSLYQEWNERINVISRRDMDEFYTHHVLHSLGIARFIHFRPGTSILDVGTGGGFPGIPLAILFPECRFLLIDSIGKKIRVATAVAEALGLTNVRLLQENARLEHGRFDFVVSRAVMRAPELVKMIRKNIAREQRNALPNGLICLKGGDLTEEIKPLRNKVQVWSLADEFTEPYFETKKVVYVPLV